FSAGAPKPGGETHTSGAKAQKSGRRLAPQSGVDPDYLKLNQAAPSSVRYSFGSADDVHLREDGFYVRLDRALTNKERRADFFIAFSLSDQLEDFDLARTQGFATDAFCQLDGEMHGNTCFAGVHPADAIHQRLTRRVLEKIAFRAGLNGAVDIFIAVERCEYDDARVLIAGADFFDCADAIEL